MKIDHIGIAVRSLAEGNALYQRLLGTAHYKIEEVASEQVATSFFQVGESKIELLEATGPESAIARFIEKRGEGIHHIAFEVADIEAEMARLESAGFVVLNKVPRRGADYRPALQNQQGAPAARVFCGGSPHPGPLRFQPPLRSG